MPSLFGICTKSSKEGHERNGKRLEVLVELLQDAFCADGIAEEHGEKVDHLVVPEAPSGKTYALGDFAQNVVLAKMSRHQHDFSEPGRGRCNRPLHEPGLRSLPALVHRHARHPW